MGSLEDDRSGVVGIDQAAARNEFETHPRTAEADGIKMAVGVKESPLAGGAAGKEKCAVCHEFAGTVLIFLDGR